MRMVPKSAFAIGREKNREADRYGNRDYDYEIGVMDALMKKQPIENEFNHWTDAGKLPNHPTFSKESWFSQFGDKKGGDWIQDSNGRWGFMPSDSQMQNSNYINNLKQYFDHEKGRGIDFVQFPNGDIWN